MKPRAFGVLLFAAACAFSISLFAQTQADMVPFTMEPRAAHAHSPVDVSFLLDAPAGKHGPVVVKDGHLATRDDGRRIRLWGVNITDWSKGSRQIPSRADAPYLADTLARFGVNAVRFQFLDLPVPRGLVAVGDNTRSLDPEAFDREDFFIAELEKRGIYIDFNLLVGRPFKAGDEVHDAALLREGAKGTSLFDTRLIELQKEYARQLLDHRNPYTRRKYTQDPAVAIVEINNEDALNVGFHAPAPFYTAELTALYNQWLAKHRSPQQIATLRELTGTTEDKPIALIGGHGASSAAPERFHTEAEFFTELQRNYFEDFERFLKQELGSQSLVIATADHNHAASGYPVLLATEGMDIIDGHTYWQHPEYYVHKLPMVNDPFNSTVVELSRSAITNKPYTVSEVNNPFPNDYAGEGIPILAAYGAFQDWDGIFWYTFEPKPDPTWKSYVGDPFDISRDPVKMPELAAGALLFLRGDVATARSISQRSYSTQQVFDSMLLPLVLALVLRITAGFCAPAQTSASQPAVTADLQRTEAALKANDQTTAAQIFQSVLKRDPGNAEAHANLGAIAFFHGDCPAAEPNFRDALQRSPGLTKIEALLSICEHRRGEASATVDMEAAFAHLEDPRLRLQLGMELANTYYQQGDFEKTASTLRGLLASDPDNVDVLFFAQRVYSELADNTLNKLAVLSPHSARMEQLIAERLINAGVLKDAVLHYRRALELSPRLPGLHFELAEALLEGSPNSADAQNEAANELRAATQVDGESARVEAQLGRLATLQSNGASPDGPRRTLSPTGQTRASSTLFAHGGPIRPFNPQPHYMLSHVDRQLRHDEESRKELQLFTDLRATQDKVKLLYRLGHAIVNNCIDCHMPFQETKTISVTAGKVIKTSIRSHWIKVYPGT